MCQFFVSRWLSFFCILDSPPDLLPEISGFVLCVLSPFPENRTLTGGISLGRRSTLLGKRNEKSGVAFSRCIFFVRFRSENLRDVMIGEPGGCEGECAPCGGDGERGEGLPDGLPDAWEAPRVRDGECRHPPAGRGSAVGIVSGISPGEG